MNFILKKFNELSNDELYQLLRLRSEIFVVEQNCVFLDLDNNDQKALHLLGMIDGEVLAYVRLFDAKQYFDEASIGRVVVSSKIRGKKYGHLLMQKGIEAIKTEFNQTKIRIGAQLYLQKFYEDNGFVVDSAIYLEDDIEHVEMIRF